MKIYNSIVSWIIKKRIHQIKLFINHPHDVQEEIMQSLVNKAKNITDINKNNFIYYYSIKKIYNII